MPGQSCGCQWTGDIPGPRLTEPLMPSDEKASSTRPLSEVTDPFDLEVARPYTRGPMPPGTGELPRYVHRGHDGRLDKVVQAAVAGTSGMAVLVGQTWTGKTRACWEALRWLRDSGQGWSLCHPVDPSPAEALLRELH